MAPGALLTDLYELNMAASYLRRGMLQAATFSLFVRRLPKDRGFLVAAGLEPALEFLTGFRFTDDDLTYLRDELHFQDDVLDAGAAQEPARGEAGLAASDDRDPHAPASVSMI